MRPRPEVGEERVHRRSQRETRIRAGAATRGPTDFVTFLPEPSSPRRQLDAPTRMSLSQTGGPAPVGGASVPVGDRDRSRCVRSDNVARTRLDPVHLTAVVAYELLSLDGVAEQPDEFVTDFEIRVFLLVAEELDFGRAIDSSRS